MADVNVKAPGKSNCYLDVEKSHSNPIYKIVIDILKHTNFFKAFTASLITPSIYIQQFWDSVRYDKTAGCYKCQLDEQWFDLTKDTLKDALQITPVNNKAFSSPPSSDALINFVNDLGYPKVARNLSNVLTNDMFQPWRALTTIINLCLTGNTSGFERPRAPRKQKFHPRPDSPLYLPNEELVLGYLKFSAKGTKREIFGMPIPGNLITADIQGSDPDSPTPKPAKATKKSKPSEPNADLRPPRVLEESLRIIYDAPRGPLLPVVIREPEYGKYQSLPEVHGKGKEKVTDEQVTLDLLTLQTPKKKSLADQFIFQRRTSTPTRSSGYDESLSLYAELELIESEQDKGQVRPNPGEQDEGQAGPNPGDAASSQPQSSPFVHAGPNLEHMDLEATDISTQPHPEQMDEGFTTTAYPKTTTETEAESMVSVTIQQDTFTIPPMTTPIIDLTSRLDSLNVHQPLQAMPTKTTTTTTTTTTIHLPPPQPQQSTTDSMLMKRIDELEHIMANLIQDNKHLEERLDNHGARLYTLKNLDIPQDFPKADMKEILHQRMWETNSYKTHKDHMMLYEALEKSMNRDHTEELLKDLAEARKKKKKSHDSPNTPPGSPSHQPPPLPPPVGQSHGSTAPSFSKTDTLAEYKAWTTTDTRIRLSVSSTLKDLQIDDDMALDAQAYSSDDEEIGNAHIPKVNLQKYWWKPLEEAKPATPEPAWSIPSYDLPIPKNNWASALASTYLPLPEDSLLAQTGPAFELVKVFYPNVIHLQYQIEECHKLLTNSVDDSIIRHNVSKPLPLGVPPGQVTIQSDFFFNKDLEYLRYGSKGSRPALSILKIKVAYYPDVGLEHMVPGQMWTEEECKYDIAAMYGISHWWFQRQRFYIDRNTSEGDRRAVRTYMWILSVARIEVFSMYGYDYMKKTVLRRADLNEYIIAKRYFKYLYPSDFEDMYLLNLQGHLNHLPPKDKKILTTVVNLWTRHLVI
uniref:Monodehydroascorbate reductase n=1 Tax=Tanacetum cinerariifolium TaxID=118510 RepID=A0A699HVX9_TANCI|nr:hypothetical protein [Tanacetum cinerariifolium]